MGYKRISELLAVSAVAAGIAGICFSTCLSWGLSLLTFVLALMGIICGLVSALLLDMCRHHPADSATFRVLLGQYLILASPLSWILCYLGYKKLIPTLADCKGAQDKTLEWIISENGNTAYGRDHNIRSIQSRDDLVAMQPLSSYAHYENYSERVAKGEKNVMTKAEVSILAVSSGTTGKVKKYPYCVGPTWKNMGLQFLGFYYNHLHELRKIGLKRIFNFRLFHPQTTNEFGVKEGGVGSVLSPPSGANIVPKCFLKTAMEPVSFYLQAVFSLAEKELGYLDGYSSDLWYSFFKFIVAHKKEICDSIEAGVIVKFEGLDEALRAEANEKMIANKARADELRVLLSGSTRGMIKRIWPGVELVTCAKSGGFAHSGQILKDTFLHGLKLFFNFHMSTEGLIGGTFDDPIDSDVYTLCCGAVFMEFIPVENMDEENPKTLFVDQLKIGGVYEVVVTNVNGLYRNRFGDVIEIVGFTGNTPKYKFLYRTGQILNIAFDRTPEKIFFDALALTMEDWKDVEVVNYTATESMHLEAIAGDLPSPAFYVTFIEVISLKDGKLATLEKSAANKLDENLQKMHETYKEFRHLDSVGPVRIIQVLPGTFQSLRYLLGGGQMNNQFKTPRVLRKEPALKLLWESRVGGSEI